MAWRLHFLAALIVASLSQSECVLRISLPPLSAIPPFFNNGSMISSRCESMYACSNDTQDIKQCSCHDFCSLFDTCCADVRPRDWQQLVFPAHVYTCASSSPWSPYVYDFRPGHSFYTTNTGVYIITDCPENSNYSSYLRALCQHPLAEVSNDIVSTPVSIHARGLTYRNIFCAVCHGESVSNVTEWMAVNLTIPEYYQGGGSRSGFVRPSDFDLHDCRRRRAAQPDCDACESGPTAYVYDSDNGTAYRNWNCSQCIATQAVSCAFGVAVNDYWWPPPAALPVPVERDYRCFGKPNISDWLPTDERAFWMSRCPAPSPQPACDRYVNGGSLERLFVARPDAEHGVAPLYAWLRLDEAGTAAVVCSACTSRRYAYSAAAQLQQGGHVANASHDLVTIGGGQYCKPFYELHTAGGYAVVCSGVEEPSNGSSRERATAAAAVASARRCPALPGGGGGASLDLLVAKYLADGAGGPIAVSQLLLVANLLVTFFGMRLLVVSP